MSDFVRDRRALLAGARSELAPSDEQRQRMDRAVGARVGIAAATLAVTTSTTAAAAATATVAGAGASVGAFGTGSSFALVGAKWALAVVLVGAAGTTLYRSLDRAPARPDGASSPPAAAPPAMTVTRPPEAPVTPRPTPSQPTAASPPPAPAIAPTPRADPRPAPAVAGTVAEEARLLRRADEALRGGDAIAALSLLDEHVRRFPASVLAEERNAERVFALCALGRAPEARDAAARFLERAPDSPLADRVRGACAQ